MRTGDTGTVMGITTFHLDIYLDDGRRVSLPRGGKTPVQLGYAYTAGQARVKMFRHALVYAATALRGPEVAAALLCRAAESVRVFTDEGVHEAGKLVQPSARVNPARMARDHVVHPPIPRPVSEPTMQLGY